MDPKTNFRVVIMQTELERWKFLVRSFLRARIAKVCCLSTLLYVLLSVRWPALGQIEDLRSTAFGPNSMPNTNFSPHHEGAFGNRLC